MSYFAEYESADGRPLIGGVVRSQSSRFSTRAEAEQRLETTKEVNAGAGRAVLGRIVWSPLPPDIFSHCPGARSQAVGGVCSGCRKKLTWADARAHEAAQQEKNPQEATHHYAPLYRIVRCYLDSGTERVVASDLTLAEAQAHCRDPESRSKTARERTRASGAWVDRFEEQKVKKRGGGWVQECRRVPGTSPEVAARRRRRFAATRPHGLCEYAGTCVEHAANPRVEACSAGSR